LGAKFCDQLEAGNKLEKKPLSWWLKWKGSVPQMPEICRFERFEDSFWEENLRKWFFSPEKSKLPFLRVLPAVSLRGQEEFFQRFV